MRDACRLRDGSGLNVPSDRIISNFKQVKLSQEDYEKVTAIGHGNTRRCASCLVACPFFSDRGSHLRYNTPVTYKPKWNINIFDENVEKSAGATVKVA